MSTPDSIANFYVDRDGHEEPIQYEARDLVNKCAPEGYHWELDFRLYNIQMAEFVKPIKDTAGMLYDYYPAYPTWPTKYIAVKNKE